MKWGLLMLWVEDYRSVNHWHEHTRTETSITKFLPSAGLEWFVDGDVMPVIEFPLFSKISYQNYHRPIHWGDIHTIGTFEHVSDWKGGVCELHCNKMYVAVYNTV